VSQFVDILETEGTVSVKVNIQSPKHLASSDVFSKTSAFTAFPFVVTVWYIHYQSLNL